MITINLKTFVKIFCFIILFFSINMYFAQNYILKGKVLSKDHKPIEFVQANLFKNDTLLVKTAYSDSLGIFSFQIEKGKYRLVLQEDGVSYFHKDLKMSQDTDLGEIQIDKAHTIEKVTITAKKKLIERKVDRLVFNVENSISATGGDALDALRVTPNIKVQNDQISMIGKSNMSVMVDDRLIHLSGEDLINYLKTLKSDNIKSIEVITNPPAKYDAEGNSGIVNIKLKKARANSWSNISRTVYRQATYPSFSVGNNFTYQKNRLNLLFDVSANKDIYIYTNDTNYYYPNGPWINKIYNKSYINHIGTTLNIGYNISKTLNIGFQYLGNMGSFKKDETSSSNIYNIENLNRVLKLVGNTKSKSYYHTLNFNLSKKLDTLGKHFTIDADYFIYNSDRNNEFNSQDFNSVVTNIYKEHVDNNNLQKINNLSARIDFDLPYQWANLSFGGKISFTETNSNINISMYNTSHQIPILISNQLDNFIYDENVQAIYFSANRKFGTKWEGKIGLRSEFTQNKGVSKSTSQINKNNYIKLFPTLYLLYTYNKENTFTISYGRRINRPSYSQLNPARWYLSTTSYEEGNPFLQPSFTSNFELSHSYKDLLITTLSFSNTKDGFGQLTIHNTDNNLQTFIRRNYYNYNSFSWSEYINYNIFSWWDTNAGLDVFYTETNTNTEYLQPKYSGWGGSFSTTNNFILHKNKTVLAQLTYEYNYPTIFGENKLEEYSSLGVGLKLLLSQKRLEISLNINNILGTDRIKISNTTQGIYETFRQYYDTQYIKLSLFYRFGNKILKTIKKDTSNEDEKRRVN